MGNFVKTGMSCPCGKSSDAYAVDAKGDGYCFGQCGGKSFKNNSKEGEDIDNSRYRTDFLEHRSIYKGTFEKYNVLTKLCDDIPIEVAFYYPNGGLKIRSLNEKKFRTKGEMGKPQLFGKNVFDRGGKKVITITEGEFDALSVSQMIQETAAVSVRSSPAAFSDCREEFEYLNSFDKIIINFDSDEAGQTAAKKVASLFDFKKVYNLNLAKHKDANAYLQSGDIKDYYEAWKGVKRYTPDSILSTMSEFRKALQETKAERLVDYPFQSLQEKLYGLHSGEIVLVKGLEGCGKSELLRAIENKVLRDTKHNVGIIHLEETNSTTLRSMAGYYTNSPMQSPEMPASDEEVLKVLEKILGESEDRFVLYSAFDVEDENSFINNIRFMITANNCKIVVLDHISWLAVDTDGKEEDERRKLDRVIQKLKKLAEELMVCIVVVSHVNDNGQTRGSRYITKASDTVIHVHRNKTTEDETERLRLYMTIEKARMIGAREGPAGYGLYDMELLMLIDPTTKGLEL